jgi:hypothetical protein
MHLADDTAEEEGDIWEDTYAIEKHEPLRCARHWRKFVDIEDGFNKKMESSCSTRQATDV